MLSGRYQAARDHQLPRSPSVGKRSADKKQSLLGRCARAKSDPDRQGSHAEVVPASTRRVPGDGLLMSADVRACRETGNLGRLEQSKRAALKEEEQAGCLFHFLNGIHCLCQGRSGDDWAVIRQQQGTA